MSELTVIGDVAFECDCGVPPSLEVHATVKPVIVSLWSLPGVKATVTEFWPWVTVSMVGASGTVAATKLSEALDAALLPTPLVATAVQVYVLPFESEPTVIGEAPDPCSVWPPSLDTHVAV